MRKNLLILMLLFCVSVFSQKTNWTLTNKEPVRTNKNVTRSDFPENYILFSTNSTDLKNQFQNAPQRLKANDSNVIIEIPNSKGTTERFKIFEFSNFEKQLQDAFPEIRSYVGIGIDDTSAQIRISLDPKGMQAMIFRGNKNNEFIEPYSDDLTTYAVYESQRNKGELPFSCSTEDTSFANRIATDVNNQNRSSAGELLIFRLALSSTSEYAAYFGATNSSQWNLVLAAYNATMTRVNGVFEKDFSIHMNITTNSQNVAYYNASTDPYSPASSLGNWNSELQATLTSVIGEANYDVGHLFGASGGGGNAGCIGCVCVNGQKGSGYTSPSNGVPMGDTFDIDYVAHELGHQFGGNHTFSHNIEGTGVNVEPGSGSTIMGYAGITTRDVQSNSDDYFVYASIKQVQDNMVGKTCPTRIVISTLSNETPTVNAGPDYTIPKSTPFILTGSGSDGNGDTLTYTWEQNNTAVTGQTGANSAASATKTGGPNWRSYSPTTSPTRYFPILSRVIANQTTTPGLEIDVEALSSVARTLSFVLTARDNFSGAGQTASDGMVVTVNVTAGPFLITAPNTAVDWPALTQQDVTWDVAGTTANGVNCPSVDIYLSTDGGNTYPITLASNITNDGSQTITVPNILGSANRIMVKGHNHIFYDLSNVNFTISQSLTDFTIESIAGLSILTCKETDVTKTIQYSTYSGFSDNTTFTVTGQPAGVTVSFSPNSISTTGLVTMTISSTAAALPGNYPITVTATSGLIVNTLLYNYQLYDNSFSLVNLISPSNLTNSLPTALNLTWDTNLNATSYDLEVATDIDFTTIIVSQNVASTTYAISGLLETSNYYWRVVPKNPSCTGTYSETFRFTTGINPCNTYSSTDVPIAISASGTPIVTSTLTIPALNNVSIADINVTVNISHTYTQDLTLTLISPNNTEVILVANQCGSNNNITATFDDAGTTLVCGTTPAITGTITPTQSLATLNGQNSEGTWTLRVTDNANADGGAINSWSLNICSTPIPLTCGQITTIWNGTSWSNGKPTDNVATTINGNYAFNENLSMCSLDIIGTSEVTISSGSSVVITNGVNVAPTANLTIQNNANLIQINDDVNTGNTVVQRNSNPLMRLDYTIWSSPISSAQTLKDFSPNTLNNRFYSYNADTNVYYSIDPLNQLFETGNGYLIRMPDNHPTTPTIWNGEFSGGVLNNGTITKNLDYVTPTQNFNIVGNPYPSTIDADDFITSNTASIFGTLYFWRKINNAAGSAYATYTLGGGTTTSPTSPTPNGTIQVGQGFFVQAKNTGNPAVSFTNAIRIGNNENQFFRAHTDVEKHRIWLNLTNQDNFFHQILVGYMTNATADFDSEIDGKYINDNGTAISSLINNEEYAIQLKGLPFNDEDTFPLLFKSTTAGTYAIAIDHVDGLFDSGNQTVYLIDHLTQATHNLSNGAYAFSTNEGTFNSRFEVVFREQALNINDFNRNAIVLYSNNNQLFINAGTEELSKVTIYDALGRKLNTFENINATSWNTDVVPQRNQVLLITIELTNGNTVTKKTIH